MDADFAGWVLEQVRTLPNPTTSNLKRAAGISAQALRALEVAGRIGKGLSGRWYVLGERARDAVPCDPSALHRLGQG